jgi:H+/Cl- antiporter ClcA
VTPPLVTLRSFLLATAVGVLSGVASWFFLWSLDLATQTRQNNPWLLFILPVAGVVIAVTYRAAGKDADRGTNLLLESVHDPDKRIPIRMAPLVWFGTVVTHLFGGSAGREGTAVQMGGSLGQLLDRVMKLDDLDRQVLVTAGIAGGFSSVFGTPLAGAVFGLEVFGIGSFRYANLVSCVVSALVADIVCRTLGAHHTLYPTVQLTSAQFLPALVAIPAFALIARGYSWLVHRIQVSFAPIVYWARPVIGGAIVVALTLLVGSQYSGLSIPLILQSFQSEAQVSPVAFALKLLLTVITLGSGFKGGEVTPLFCIGATLGHSIANFTQTPVAPLAALGFVGVFAGAANTPLACALMGVELFGSATAPWMLGVCVAVYLLTGHEGIYRSQQLLIPKLARTKGLEPPTLSSED